MARMKVNNLGWWVLYERGRLEEDTRQLFLSRWRGWAPAGINRYYLEIDLNNPLESARNRNH